MSRKLGAWMIAGALSLVSAGALADVAGAPAGGTGGNGGGGAGGTTTTSTETDKKSSGGGCSAVTLDGAGTSAAFLVGLGLLLAVPAMRRRRANKGDRG